MRILPGLLLGLSLLAQPRPLTLEEAQRVPAVGEIAAAENSADLLYAARGSWVALSGGKPVDALRGASMLRWSPDGTRVAFFRGEALHVLDWFTRASVKVCDVRQSNAYLAHAGNRLSWSPDGKWLAFTGTLEPPPPASDPVVVTRVLYKSRTSLSDNRRTHVFVVPASGGAPNLLTPGDNDEHSIDWGGGEEIVFLSNRSPNADAVLNYDLYAVNPVTGAVRQITRTRGVEMNPRLSPDGTQIAYTATTRAVTTIDSVAEDAHVWVIPSAGGTAREVAPGVDRRMSNPQWDGGTVLFTAGDHGKTVLYRGSTRMFDEAAQIGAPVRHKGAIYFTFSDPLRPRELYRMGQGPVTDVSAAALKDRVLVQPEVISFRSFDGTAVQGWLYAPPAKDGKRPMILSIHGGPHGMSGYGFSANTQAMAGHGYYVLQLNPRGSSGYGQKFSDGCVNNWGGGDYRDLMRGVDHVLKTHPQIDPQRLGVIGGSYGGFMTNWVVTQTTRFKAAVSAASVSNLISFYATSLYQDLVHQEFNGYPWEGRNFETLWRWSPLRYVRNVTTPVLFVHGELDNDVHITQAEEMYTALRQRGVEAVLVRYPREGHGFREPKHQLDYQTRAREWFDRFLRP